MSEPAASYRPLSGAEEFDRRIRSLAQSQPAPNDALAELARLVGQHDPFRETAGVGQADVHEREAAPDTAPVFRDEALADRDPFLGYHDAGEEPGAPVEPAVVHAPEPKQWERAVPRYPSISVRDDRPIEPSPDAWAQGADVADEAGAAPAITHAADPQAAPVTSPKRTLVVLAAVVVLTGGGLAASFLARPSTTAMGTATSTAAPTIMASTGPSKVQPVAAATGDDAPSEPSTLLDKNKNDGTNMAKIVNSVEQPVDLAQAIKATPADPVEPAPAAANGFPEPRKVKTVLVRPDGSVIADAPANTAASAAPAPIASQQASLAFDPKTALPITPTAPTQVDVPPPVVQPPSSSASAGADDWAQPAAKTTTRATAVKPATSTSPDGSAAAQARTTVATPKAKPVVKAAKIVKPKPAAAVADAADVAPTAAETAPAESPAATGGGYAIQLGAAPSEAEGKTAATRLGQKYASDLGGAKPSIHKATAAGKTVYRIRVGGLSQESAKALCAKIAATGGGCFVARN